MATPTEFGEGPEQLQAAHELLQEVPGRLGMTREEALREEAVLKQRTLKQMAQDFGYRQPQPGPQAGSSATAATSAAQSSSATASLNVHKRVLKQRMSDPTGYTKQTVREGHEEGRAEDNHMCDEGDEELMPDHAQPEEQPPAWWSSALGAVERHIDGYGEQMSRMS